MSAKADGEFLADFAVVVGDDVVGVGVETDQAGDFDVDTGFFLDLAGRCLGQRLAWLDLAAWDRVQVVVGAADHQDSALVVLNEGADRNRDAVRLRCARVVQVVPPRHTAP